MKEPVPLQGEFMLVLLFLLGCSLGCGPGGSASREKSDGSQKESGSSRLRGALGPMPWYDSARDDYHRYDAETIRKEIPKEETKQVRPAEGRLNTKALELFVYVFLAAVAVALAVFLARFIRERQRPIGRRRVGGVVRHSKLMDEVGTHDIPLEEDTLIRLIEAALQASSQRAAVLMFVYALLVLARKELLDSRPQSTAREAVRALASNGAVDDVLKERFARTGRSFEEALYAGRQPDAPLDELWAYWKEMGAS